MKQSNQPSNQQSRQQETQPRCAVRRKSVCAIAAAAAVALSLCGCGAKPSAQETPPPAPSGSSASSAQPTENTSAPASSLRLLTPVDGLSLGAGSESGHYSLSARTDGSLNIMYIDYATGAQMVLCGRPECTHNNDTCAGWLPAGQGGAYMAMAGQTLCCLFGGQSTMVGMADSTLLPQIITMQQDGSQRKTVLTMTAEKGIGLPLVGDDNSLYFICITYAFAAQGVEAVPELMQVSVADGAVRSVYKWTAQDNVKIIGVYGDSVVTSVYHTETGNTWSARLEGVSTVDSTVQSYASWNSADMAGAKEAGVILGEWYCYWGAQQESIMAYSLKTQVDTQLAALPGVQQNHLTMRATVGDTVLYDVFSPGPTPADGVVQRYGVTPANPGAAPREIALYNTSESTRVPWQLIAQTADKLLVQTASVTAPIRGYDKDGTPIQVDTVVPQYALISKQDYIDSRDTAVPMALPMEKTNDGA